MTKFEDEKARVGLLMTRLGLAAEAYDDPNAGVKHETGADVVVAIGGRRIGVQVTDVDPGPRAGEARGAEKRLASAAKAEDRTAYFAWGQNDPAVIVARIAAMIERKARISVSGFDEFWLLMCAGVPTLGAVTSTLIMTPWLAPEALDDVSRNLLEASRYTRAYLLAIFGVEEQALYEWRQGAGWSKSTLELPPVARAPDFWTYKDDPDLLADPEGWCDREIERVLAEMRPSEPGGQ